MTFKKEYLILGVIIIALSSYLVFYNRDRSTYELPEVAAVDRNDITKIEIVTAGERIELGREGSDWKIVPQAYPADADKVKSMLDGLSAFALTALVSESENYEIYELDPAHGVQVKAWAKDAVVREFEAGKAASSFSHTFVKLPGNPNVYHARDNLQRKFDVSTQDLRDKTVMSFEKDTIEAFTVEKEGLSMVFTKKAIDPEKGGTDAAAPGTAAAAPSPPQWVNQNDEPADAGAIQQLLSTLSGLKCEKYIEDKTKDAFNQPIYTILLTGAQERRLTVYAALEEDDDAYPAVSSDSPHVFLLPKWRGDNIMKDPAEMLKKEDKPQS